ncbi:unnamed protein product [Diamesa serratosioi]
MKYTIALSVVLFALCIFEIKAGMDKEVAFEMFKGMAMKCKDQEKATDADLQTMVAKKALDTKTAKCLGACMLENFGLIVDGKMSKEGLMNYAKMMVDEDSEKLKVAEQICNDCAAISDADRCELAMKLENCIVASSKKRNVDFLI